MRVLYYNARSLLPKIDNLLLSVKALNPHIVCVVESWLSEEIDDNEINIQLFCSDRNRHGGGVLMYVSSIFIVSVMSPPPPVLTLSLSFESFRAYFCIFLSPT